MVGDKENNNGDVGGKRVSRSRCVGKCRINHSCAMCINCCQGVDKKINIHLRLRPNMVNKAKRTESGLVGTRG